MHYITSLVFLRHYTITEFFGINFIPDKQGLERHKDGKQSNHIWVSFLHLRCGILINSIIMENELVIKIVSRMCHYV